MKVIGSLFDVSARCILLIISLILVSCGQPLHERMGFSEADWNDLSSSERVGYLHAAEAVQAIQNGTNTPSYRARRALSVYIQSGTALMGTDFTRQAYEPIHAVFEQDTCKDLTLKAQAGRSTTTLRACFYGHEFWLDPSPTQIAYANYSARLFETSLWRKFIYNHVNTNGYVGFDNVNIAVKLLDYS